MRHISHSPLVVLAAVVTGSTLAAAPIETSAARASLRQVPVAEMPAQAARLLSTVSQEDQIPSAVNIVAAAHMVRPAATLAVVGAVARQAPSAAPAVAVKALALQRNPKSEWVDQVAAAVAAAAPAQAAAIVEAMVKAAPQYYATVATAVAAAVPQAKEQVLMALTRALPGLRPFVDQARSRLGPEASVAALLQHVNTMVIAAAQASKTKPELVVAGGSVPPPTYGPPFTPLPPGEVTEITRTTTRVARPGQGRDYSTP
ncbi:MAG: hypothetical protein RMN51_05915 [Verrucomicrobiota bacterium]|nr:hypothetical protein [Limisphaera sp.]MDW8381628.1 hypothetical protein [Verrucomicrobiota bacterium]